MDSVLLVTSSEKSSEVLTDILINNSHKEIVTAKNCETAGRLLIERDFYLCIIDIPEADKFEENFARTIAMKGNTQVLLIVKSEMLDEISSRVEDLGILTVPKPISRKNLCSVLKLAKATYNKLAVLHNENKKLMQKIEDIRLIDRAKCILIEYLSMTETQAHKYIEKQAMDMRITKREAAMRVLKTYER